MHIYIDINMTPITPVSCLKRFQNIRLNWFAKSFKSFRKNRIKQTGWQRERTRNFTPNSNFQVTSQGGFGISWKDRNIVYDEFFHQDACVAVVVLFLQTHAREHDATSANTNLCESTRKTQKPLFKRTYFFFSIGSLASLAFHTKL